MHVCFTRRIRNTTLDDFLVIISVILVTLYRAVQFHHVAVHVHVYAIPFTIHSVVYITMIVQIERYDTNSSSLISH